MPSGTPPGSEQADLRLVTIERLRDLQRSGDERPSYVEIASAGLPTAAAAEQQHSKEAYR